MERSILKELNKKNVEAYINRAREAFYKRMFWTLFFQLKYTTQLTWESLSGSSGAPIMADVIEYNSSAPEKTRRTISKRYGDIPKTAIKRSMDEKDMNDYNVLSALADDNNKKALLDIVFADIDFCYTGALARTEYLAMQALSYGSLTLDSDNNNGIITETDVDFGIPSANKTAVGTVWSTAAGATPIADIEEVVKDAKDAGHRIANIVMDLATYHYMIATDEVKDRYAVFQRIETSRKTIPTEEELNAMLSAYKLPTILIVDSSVRFENKDHTITTLDPWKTGYVSFIPEMKVGRILHGPIAKENSDVFKKTAIMTKKDHVLLSKWSNPDPFGEWTEAQANFFPTFNDVDAMYILKTNGTSWS